MTLLLSLVKHSVAQLQKSFQIEELAPLAHLPLLHLLLVLAQVMAQAVAAAQAEVLAEVSAMV